MMSDLRNLKVLAWFLQKFELNFDILSSLKELSKQIKGEFDFRWAEAFHLRPVPLVLLISWRFERVFCLFGIACPTRYTCIPAESAAFIPVKETLEGYLSFASSITLTGLKCLYSLIGL